VADDFHNLALTAPGRPSGDPDDEQMLAKARGSSRWDLTVVDVVWIAPRILRLMLSAAGIEAMEWVPARDFTLLITRAMRPAGGGYGCGGAAAS
jgi:hypothetical protein